jgi:putative transposase
VPVGCKLDAETHRLRLIGVGLVKLVLHRAPEGMPKTATVTHSRTGKWSVCFACACPEPAPLPMTGAVVGIDVGLTTFATLSTGEAIASPSFFHREERTLAKVQRANCRMEQGTPERAK